MYLVISDSMYDLKYFISIFKSRVYSVVPDFK